MSPPADVSSCLLFCSEIGDLSTAPPCCTDQLGCGHCQLKRLWYARRVGGAAARVGELLYSPIMLPRSSRAAPEKAPWVR
jgi:hypothetical protein